MLNVGCNMFYRPLKTKTSSLVGCVDFYHFEFQKALLAVCSLKYCEIILECYEFWSAMVFGVLCFENMCVNVFFENIFVFFCYICTCICVL